MRGLKHSVTLVQIWTYLLEEIFVRMQGTCPRSQGDKQRDSLLNLSTILEKFYLCQTSGNHHHDSENDWNP